MEHFSTMMRDDILMWALSHPNYTTWFKTHDTPLGCGLPPLPEIHHQQGEEGDVTENLHDLRQRLQQEQDARIEQILATTDDANLVQRQVITLIRRVRALQLASDKDNQKKWREANEELWDFWCNEFPASIKQRHYHRGLNACFVLSFNEVACAETNQRYFDLKPHSDRAPLSGRHADRWIECSGGIPERLPPHVLVDLSRFCDCAKYFRSPLVIGPGHSSQWSLPESLSLFSGIA